MGGQAWTPTEENRLRALKRARVSTPEIAKALGRSYKSVSVKLSTLRAAIPESEYAAYVDPPTLEGDCLILSDLEAPFHEANFVNDCIGLCKEAGIDKLFLAGENSNFFKFCVFFCLFFTTF